MEYQAVIGLEVHAQLKTRTKIFCGCLTEFGSQPNSQVCPICLGLPGCLPVLNRKAFEYAITVAIALGCRIAEFTKFDRKNYFYPDLPKNYQISQYDLPIGEDGFLDIRLDDTIKRINIKRVHLEEDAGKLIHALDCSCVDFNRTGMPLLEIVSQPDLNSPQEAYEYLITLKQIIRYLGASSCDMEKGILRCDANISVRKKSESELGIKTELKNMNSFAGVRTALDFEIKRQVELLSNRQLIIQETRLWDTQKQATYSMRTKEDAQDYRYFPEPDLPPLIIDSQLQKRLLGELPELPQKKQARFIEEYQLSAYDINLLASEKEIADFFENCFKLYPEAKIIANWICGPLLSELNNHNSSITQINITPLDLVSLIKLVQEGKISNIAAKGVLTKMIDTGESAAVIIQRDNLIQISDTGVLDKIIDQVIEANPGSVNDYQKGKENAVMFLVGQVMRASKGKANPKMVLGILKKRLSEKS
ncbi:MAG: Asp-tRNA(Asn)/Glu-tRNA(Gln) amidotransferase subunit GatB [Candidatus Omnitrophota bacterium]